MTAGQRDLRRLPKVHLHTHLESTVRPGTIRDLGGEAAVRREPYGSFAEFSAERSLVRALLREHDHFRRIAEEFCADEAAQGVRYAEVTFTAAGHGERLGDPEMPLAGVVEGLAAGGERYGVETRLILDHPRRRPVERLRTTLALATRYEQVVAIGLAGDEAHPVEPFARVLREARDAGLHLVHHAGESQGPASVRAALDVGLAERIGHGIRALEDPELVAELRDRQVPLEVCPTSNVLLGLVPSLAAHPLPRLAEAGLLVTLSTDGETTLSQEYRRVRETFSYEDGELARLAHAAVTAGFAPRAVKTRIAAEIDTWLHGQATDTSGGP